MSVADYFDMMDYAPAPESQKEAEAWLQRHAAGFGLFVDGAWCAPADGGYLDSLNPASGAPLGRIARATVQDVDKAVDAAVRAQPEWQALGGHGRARVLYALARLVQRHSRLLAVLESLDNGKPIRESRDIDVPLVARHFYHHAGWAQLLDQDAELAQHAPVGVCGQIVPWNFPLLMLAWKIAPALACGNTVVLKPSELTSLSALKFAELAEQAGLPAGVLNLVTGDGQTGEALVDHPQIDKIAFTGSTAVGRRIRERTAGSGKALTLELGGKSPFIVFDDADLDAAVEGVVDAIWFNQGEVCCAGSRLLVQESIAEDFYSRLRRRMATLRVGSPLDKSVDVGALVDARQRQRIAAMVSAGREAGCTVWQADGEGPETGAFYPPTLCTDLGTDNPLWQDEVFGPVLAAMTFRTPDEAVQLANNTRYGLAASVWSESISLALDIVPQLQCGVVWVNATNMLDAAAPFGGYRESGFGREGGREGLFEYLTPRLGPCVAQSWQAPAASTSDATPTATAPAATIDRTAKHYIGGKQVRPDGGTSRPVQGTGRQIIGDVGEGNRKDIRNAVEAARKAGSWSTTPAHGRAQILYYLAENLETRAPEFADRLRSLTGCDQKAAEAEVGGAVHRLFTAAAWADKFAGGVDAVPMRALAVTLREPLGVLAIAAPAEAPLLGFVSLLAPAIAAGNRVVIVPAQTAPLSATDFYQVLETSDVPDGVVNIVTGDRDDLSDVLARHLDVDGIWYVGPADGCRRIEAASAGNLKQVWTNQGKAVDWHDPARLEGPSWMRRASQTKTVWIPYGA
ncbi:aldehyde dehydrogenase family protein [Rhodovibrio salinarum]|uniref:Aldehyde dehydrogenase n=1 Tax=Rhodovibrio salinarum TaxID=1087 RepID=A0A934UZA5_9PROT|nr:aldehyde dehydrogenase family protein [Rhodovibrio salinarum]MBK1696209.1 aldehyde dehydrogenase [Rhodovibrio salinarum]